MPDIGAGELLVIAIVAILVIGPKDMPMALRTAGRWIAQFRRVSGHFRAGLDAMVREAEMEEMEKKWKERNAQIMREHPGETPIGDELAGDEMKPLPPPPTASSAPVTGSAADTHDPDADDPAPDTPAHGNHPPAASAEARTAAIGRDAERDAEPQLPLDPDRAPRDGTH